MKSLGRRITIWAGWGVSLFFIGWAVMKMDLGKVFEALKLADYRLVAVGAVLNATFLLMRGERWRHLIDPIKHVTFWSSFSALCIGFMANMVLPARIGEFVRAYVIARRESISKSSAFGTVVIERSFDGLSIVVMLLLIFTLIDPPEAKTEFWNALRVAGVSASVFFIVFFAGMYLFHKQYRFMVRAIDFSTGLLPAEFGSKVREVIESLRKGLDALDHGHRLAKVIAWSAVIWGTAGFYNWLIFRAFDLDVPFSASYLALASQVIGVMIPSAPGFIGVYHAATIAALMFYGVEGELALSVALVTHIVMFIMSTLPGLAMLWLEQYSFSDIQHAAD